MILIGSKALQYWQPDIKFRVVKDWDIIVDENDDRSEISTRLAGRCDFHSSEELLNAEVENYVGDVIEINGLNLKVCNLKGLALIKRSHLWRDYFFDKHITYYHKRLLPFIDNFNKNDLTFLKKRTKLTKKKFKQGNPSLKQSNDDFFDDAVKKVYEHDWIHELVAYNERPMYEKLKQSTNLDIAWCEKDLWASLSDDDKCKCVAEETFVIAIERFLIPNNWNFAWKLAFYKSLQKVCTTLTSGWFRDYAIDNYPRIIQLYDEERILNVKNIIVELDNAI